MEMDAVGLEGVQKLNAVSFQLVTFKSYIFFLCMTYVWTFITNAFIINR